MKITWKKCERYEEVKNNSGIIYLYEWSGRLFYWSKCSSFRSRYETSYRHLIEGCLRH